ncbi:hypothetical protein ACFPH8_05380 [Bizionia hallyeonensis]|uniref:Uncharacterized protein n=1 Tax=Bizionia hallyeonensis TaxID=1123757 RepID=A0ABW0C3I8_9FLAO
MEKPLKDKHSALINSLYKPLIFYIPRKLWADLDDGKWLDKEFDPIFDTVVLMHEDGSNHVLNNDTSNYHMMSKGSALDKNIYELLDLKAQLTTEAFSFLSERYSLSVAFYKKVSSWMLEHVKLDIPAINGETLKSFEIQKLAFNSHWDYIQEHFSVPEHVKNHFAEVDLSSKEVIAMRDFMSDSEQKSGNIHDNLQKAKNKSKKRKEKQVLITAEEAEKFLLETVFSVKL